MIGTSKPFPSIFSICSKFSKIQAYNSTTSLTSDPEKKKYSPTTTGENQIFFQLGLYFVATTKNYWGPYVFAISIPGISKI
jgi:hypothetical protein